MAETHIEGSRTSLLDIVMNRYNNMKDKTIYSRVFYAAEKGNEKSMQEFHERLFQLTTHQFDQYYGILYETTDAYIHMLEGSTNCIMDFLRVLEKEVSQSNELGTVRILFYMDDIGTLSFPRWACKDVSKTDKIEEDLMLEKLNDREMEIFLMKKIHHTMHQLLAIGKEIKPLGPRQMNLYLSTLPQNYPEIVPSPEIIELLAKCNVCLTLTEFIQVYDTPVDIELESEMVHPVIGTEYLQYLSDNIPNTQT